MEKNCWKGHLSMLAANVMWGGMSPLAKLVLISGAISPLVITDLRITGAMILFWIASFFQKSEHVPHQDLLRIFIAALMAVVFNQGCFITGVGLSSPGDASIITTSMPLWAMILAAVILKEPITGKKIVGIAAGASGALLLIIGSSHSATSSSHTGSNYLLGDTLVMLAQMSYALYLVLYKNFVTKYSLITLMKWMFTYAFICLLPFSAADLMAAHWDNLHAAEIGSLAFIVVGATFGCYILVVIGQKTLRPTVAGMYNYVQPIVACLISIYWGMDHFNLLKCIAIVLIFGGVYLVTSSRSRQEVESYHATHSTPKRTSK